jgi:hypothetical protein
LARLLFETFAPAFVPAASAGRETEQSWAPFDKGRVSTQRWPSRLIEEAVLLL